MAKPKHPVWAHYHQSATKINNSHYAAYCKYCVKKHKGVFRDETKVTGQPERMKAHLAKCVNAPEDIRDQFAAMRQLKPKSSSSDEMDVTDRPVKRMPKKKVMENEESEEDAAKHGFRRSATDATDATDVLHMLLLNATVSANLPMDWIDNWEVLQLFRFMSPYAKFPDASTLWDAAIALRVNNMDEEEVAALRKASMVGLACNPWVQAQAQHVLAWNVVGGPASQRTVLSAFQLQPLDATAQESVDAVEAMVYAHFLECMVHVANVTNSQARVAWLITDGASPMHRKLKQLVALKHPQILVVDGLADIIGSIAKELMAANPTMRSTIQTAMSVVMMFLSHPVAMNVLQTTQMQAYGATKDVICPQQDDWRSLVDALESLESSQAAIMMAAREYHDRLMRECTAPGSTTSPELMKALLAMVQSTDLWDQVQRALQVLRPLRTADAHFREPTARLDTSFRMLGRLVAHYHHLSKQPPGNEAQDQTESATDDEAAMTITGLAKHCMQLIETHWDRMDQPPFVLANVLNPFMRLDGLCLRTEATSPLSRLKLMELATALYARVFEQLPKKMYLELTDYMEQTNAFATDRIEQFRTRAALEPEIVWRYASESYEECARLATLLLSVSVQTASLDDMLGAVDETSPIAQTDLKKRIAWAKIKRQIQSQQATTFYRPNPVLATATANDQATAQPSPPETKKPTTPISSLLHLDQVLNTWKDQAAAVVEIDATAKEQPVQTDAEMTTNAAVWKVPLDQIFVLETDTTPAPFVVDI